MFVERRSQIASLDRIFQQSVTGKGGTSLIVGPVASGKTELLKVFAERLSAEGATVLEAVGSPRERDQAFGILQQLFAALPDRDERTRIQQLLADRASRLIEACGGESSADSGGGAQFLRNHANQDLWTEVQRLSDRAPVAIVVDDLQHADLASLQSLLFFSGRLRSARVIIVATQLHCPLSSDQERAVLVTELLRQPRFRLVRTGPLSADGVREMLAEHIGVAVDQSRAETWHRITGGSPFLLKALIEDNEVSGRSQTMATDDPVVGEEFAKAVLACLHRAGRRFLATARCVAVLSESGSLGLLPQLVGESEITTTNITDAIASAGILADQQFRHPGAQLAVLSELSSPERTRLHRRAADLLHDNGEPACRIGVHLVEAGRAGDPWALEVLMSSAQDALHRDALGFAAKCVRLAETIPSGSRQQVALAVLRIQVEFRGNPDNATEQLATVLEAVRAGRLDIDQMIGLLNPLLRQGRAAEAALILQRLALVADDLDDRSAADLSSVRTWMRSTCPGLLVEAGTPDELSGGAEVTVVANRSVRGPALLADAMEFGPTEHTTPTAEWLLQTTPLHGTSLDSIIAALLALVHADRSDLAERWCDSLLREAVSRDARTWQASLAAVRAEIALRQGDMPGALRIGLAASGLLPREAWGVAIGEVTSTVLLAATALGDWQTADGCLTERTDAMFDTRYGAQFLYARGRRLLAADRLRAAMDDLRTCGRLLREWGIDQPTFLPWRADAVAVLLRMGNRRQAAELAAEQLAMTSAELPRARGIALRTVAATETDSRARMDLLLRAIESFDNSADRVELAYAVADLADVYVVLGEPRRARQATQRATRLAEELSLAPLRRRLDIGSRPVESVPFAATSGAPEPDNDVLSAAERRVVMLAAGGHTNREIAAELFITVSTVEQHLTRVYRKLRVKGRGDLAAYLTNTAPPPRSAGTAITTTLTSVEPTGLGIELGQRGAA
ncbi:LuxR family transcriptional regulator [Nocardia callitridis]|uniref:LuxR family transcriptional regulator n=1 Tax=Nocardia callitridis TaxID=648753 RepID=A0ABP9KUT8_9NOCA